MKELVKIQIIIKLKIILKIKYLILKIHEIS
jgi:hypothetical protein